MDLELLSNETDVEGKLIQINDGDKISTEVSEDHKFVDHGISEETKGDRRVNQTPSLQIKKEENDLMMDAIQPLRSSITKKSDPFGEEVGGIGEVPETQMVRDSRDPTSLLSQSLKAPLEGEHKHIHSTTSHLHARSDRIVTESSRPLRSTPLHHTMRSKKHVQIFPLSRGHLTSLSHFISHPSVSDEIMIPSQKYSTTFTIQLLSFTSLSMATQEMVSVSIPPLDHFSYHYLVPLTSDSTSLLSHSLQTPGLRPPIRLDIDSSNKNLEGGVEDPHRVLPIVISDHPSFLPVGTAILPLSSPQSTDPSQLPKHEIIIGELPVIINNHDKFVVDSSTEDGIVGMMSVQLEIIRKPIGGSQSSSSSNILRDPTKNLLKISSSRSQKKVVVKKASRGGEFSPSDARSDIIKEISSQTSNRTSIPLQFGSVVWWEEQIVNSSDKHEIFSIQTSSPYPGFSHYRIMFDLIPFFVIILFYFIRHLLPSDNGS